MARDRGIGHVEKNFGDFLDVVDHAIKTRGKVRILESGCGVGVAMMGFVKRFGENVEMVGFNYSKQHGNRDKLKKKAVKKELFSEDELSGIRNLPTIVCCDADERLPFKDDSFDFIYSQAAIYLLKDKIRFFEECFRLLKRDGIARLKPGWAGSMSKKLNPKEYREGWEIWDQGKIVKATRYMETVDGIQVKYVNGKSPYCEFGGRVKPDYKLKFVTSVDTNTLHSDFMGVKSIYTTQREYTPHWKNY